MAKRERECKDLKGNIEERACKLAAYIIENGATVRSAARKFVAEALAPENVSVTDVLLSSAGQGRIQLEVLLDYQGSDLSVTLTV